MNEFREQYASHYRRAGTGRGACPSGESLAALAAGRAWPWQRRRLAAHLSECTACADDYRAIRATRPEMMAELEAHAAESRRSLLPAWQMGAMAAAAALAVALGLDVFMGPVAPDHGDRDGVLFASEFEPGAASNDGRSDQPQRDRLFRSDFGEAAGRREG